MYMCVGVCVCLCGLPTGEDVGDGGDVQLLLSPLQSTLGVLHLDHVGLQLRRRRRRRRESMMRPSSQSQPGQLCAMMLL